MKHDVSQIDQVFRLQAIKAGKISDISEATAASPVPPHERVNFHIGNPVQDERLTLFYLRTALGVAAYESSSFDADMLVNELGSDSSARRRIEFLYSLLKASAPYSPRGGYNIKNPMPLVKKFYRWLVEEQDEPLAYDLGEKTGKREIVISSGGVDESLRILFRSLNSFLVNLPATIFLYNWKLPKCSADFESLSFFSMPPSESTAIELLVSHFKLNASKPVYLVIGNILSEDARRKLRSLALSNPLFFIEVNDAPNHLSLAREAKLKNRVLRFITPFFISSRLKNLSVVFVAGIFELLKVFESVHFQLKGTPSSSEIELLHYLLANGDEIDKDEARDPLFDHLALNPYCDGGRNFNFKAADKISGRINRAAERTVEILLGRSATIEHVLSGACANSFIIPDSLSALSADEILLRLFASIDSKEFLVEIEKCFLGAFASHYPEYSINNLTVVSGSSRTALGLLGFHCGINEIVTCDYSWTYEHCFPKSLFIPLKDDFELDVDGICDAIEKRLEKGVAHSGIALMLNNPHNASGNIFAEESIRELLVRVLDKDIFVIDDLAYMNVLPAASLDGPKTVKQLALQLVKEGRLYKEQLEKIVTVHSLSKTDSFAGARLAVVEIADAALSERFNKLNSLIKPNIAAITAAYLFYRSGTERIKNFWFIRNKIFDLKMKSLETAQAELPESRNQFGISIVRPKGSMYPRMVINNLPNGLSLDWLSSGLAAQGIGLIPLSAFARTAKGFELARKSFRLTLGGTDSPEILLRKTRRVLIDLNRLAAEEKSKYNKIEFALSEKRYLNTGLSDGINSAALRFFDKIKSEAEKTMFVYARELKSEPDANRIINRFIENHLRGRLESFRNLFSDQLELSLGYLSKVSSEGNGFLKELLEFEFYKDDLSRRTELFRKRAFDRTVHPTQLYALEVEILFNSAFNWLLNGGFPSFKLISKLATALVNEFLGRNIAINSVMEGDELICDLTSLIGAENFYELRSNKKMDFILSFWGDWDGSNRPSGQGHRLVASALIENVNNLAALLRTILSIDSNVKVDAGLIAEVDRLAASNKEFWALLNHITALTNQLEKRYRSLIPFSVESGRLKNLAIKLHLARDPVFKLWQHNDRLEQKMMELRLERRKKLEYYFKLNKELRKTLYNLIPFILKNTGHQRLFLQAALYRDTLKRFVLTPRIHQKMITARDQFAINTTVHNIFEINSLSAGYGNPAIVMGLQVSMSTSPEPLIELDKKFISERERVLKNSKAPLPKVWSIPLFEDIDTVSGIENYLDKIWDYAVQSRSISQSPNERFAEIICEVFIAGSDLSQQTGQTASALLYSKAKHKTIEWLAKKGLVEFVRIKLGSGEPMQRQGGYYAEFSGRPAFIKNDENEKRLANHLTQSTIKSTEFAVSPLHGIFAGGDLRTLQSAISEKLRFLSLNERAQILYHLNQSQQVYHSELIRASEPFIDTRLLYESRLLGELERLTLGKKDELFESFAGLAARNFQQILYGSADDVVGIHIISYFLSKAAPVLRDRPVDRPARGVGDNKGQKILERIASTIPLCKHGSLLRAISHNKAQTFILGINQLTTGLFRGLNQFARQDFIGGSGEQFITDRILTRLPVYEILHTLRVFHDRDLSYISKFYGSFPAGLSAFNLLREDNDSMDLFIPALQKELLRRHGIDVSEFFEGDKFIYELLPTLRPDLAVLLQPDLFNTNPEAVFDKINYRMEKDWKEGFANLLAVPVEINEWRLRIWNLLEEPVKNQVKSFVELAIALNKLSKDTGGREFTLTATTRKTKYETSLAYLLRGKVDDSMRQFLSAAVQYLTRLPAEMVEVPVDIIRALKDVELILQIEEEALSKKKQELLNFYLIQIARLAGDNG